MSAQPEPIRILLGDDDASATHAWLQSNLHRSEDACGTCHDVSNPLTGDLAHNNGAQVPLAPGDFSDVLGGPVTRQLSYTGRRCTSTTILSTTVGW